MTYDGFFQVTGVRLDAKQADGSHQSFTIRPNPGGLAEVCGSNDKPISASLVKEV